MTPGELVHDPMECYPCSVAYSNMQRRKDGRPPLWSVAGADWRSDEGYDHVNQRWTTVDGAQRPAGNPLGSPEAP